MKKRYHISPDGKSILCLTCGRESHNPHDVINRYCGHCHVFHEDEAMAERISDAVQERQGGSP